MALCNTTVTRVSAGRGPVLQALLPRGDGALGDKARQSPAPGEHPFLGTVLLKKSRTRSAPRVYVLRAQGDLGHPGVEVEARGIARGHRSHPWGVAAGWGRGQLRSDSSGAPEGAVRTACLLRVGRGSGVGGLPEGGDSSQSTSPPRPCSPPAPPPGLPCSPQGGA